MLLRGKPDLLAVLRKIEARGASEMAHRVRVICGQVFRYAIATGRAERDVAADLKGALVPHKSTPHPAVSEAELPALLNDIAKYRGDPVTRATLELLALTFVRVEELVGATWDEIDLDGRLPTRSSNRRRKQHHHPLPGNVFARTRAPFSTPGSRGDWPARALGSLHDD